MLKVHVRTDLSSDMPKLRIALIDDDIERASFIKSSLIEHGFRGGRMPDD